MAAHTSDFSKLPLAIVLDLINEQNGTSLPANALSFGVPALTGTDAIESTITVTAESGSGYKGFVELTYNRVNLSFIDTNEPDLIVETEAATIHDLLPFLNSTLGVNFQPEDIVDGPLPETEPNQDDTVTLTATAGSLVWAGSYVLTLTKPLVELNTVLLTTTLDGLYPPTAPV